MVAFIVVDRFLSNYGPQTKQAKKRCRPYTSLFFRHEHRIFKIAHICSQDLKISFYMQSLVYFSAHPTFGLRPLTLFVLATVL